MSASQEFNLRIPEDPQTPMKRPGGRMTPARWRLVLRAISRGLDNLQEELDDEQNLDRYVDEVPEDVRARWDWQEVELRELRAAFNILWDRHGARS